MNKIDREKILEKRREDDKKIITELHKVGIQVNSVFDLVNTRQPYPKAIPVLVNLLKEDLNSDWMKEGIVRALTVKEAKGIANKPLLELYNSLPKDKSGIRWTIGNAINIIATKDDENELLRIVTDSDNGDSRMMFIRALGKLKSEESEKTLIDLLNDKDCAEMALSSLSKLKSTKAIEKVKLLVNDKRTSLRNAAKKFLIKMG